MYLIFDTETTGLPKKWKAPISDTDNWPRCVQLAWQLHDKYGNLLEQEDFLIQPDGYDIPYDAESIHGISTALAQQEGIPLAEALERFNEALAKTTFIVGQNLGFDVNIMGCEFYRLQVENPLEILAKLDTCTEKTASLCKLPGGRYGKFKLPTLTELHEHLFQQPFAEAHNATADVAATTRCFLELIRQEVYSPEELQQEPVYFKEFQTKNSEAIQPIDLKHVNLKKASAKLNEKPKKVTKDTTSNESLVDVAFSHLHNYTRFSVLQSTITITDLVAAAGKANMPAVAFTDSGNMMGAFRFVSAAEKYNNAVIAKNEALEAEGQEPTEKQVKPIIGIALNVCENHLDKKNKDNGYQIVFLAKNKKGYHNLAKMSSIAFTEGFYYVPRIDRTIVEKYKEDLIVLTGNLYGEVPNKILNIGKNQAEDALVWWKEQFQDDLYIEIMRHHQEDEDRVNETLIAFSEKHDIKLVATNSCYYINQEDSEAHDILLCIKDGEKRATPIGRGRGYRYGLPNQEYYFKSSDEMKSLFNDIPEAIINTQEIVDKVAPYTLAQKVLLPKFDIPAEFVNSEDEADGGKRGENAFLKHLVFKGAKKRYGETLSDEVVERLDFELEIIEKTGYPGYFLIVEDFIRAARDMDVSVGPGRGSAAGSVAAYCLWITNIDPLKYDLLFERFLNPERVSMPDIDIDFDDEGRGKVIDYVINKYGKSQVAQIITYGTMAAKSSIRDTSRALDLPLDEAGRIAGLIPNMKLNKIFNLDEATLKKDLRPEEFEKVQELISRSQSDELEGEMINKARVLEGSLRNVGTHACGVIITPDDITNHVPVSTAKDSDMFVTQFDNGVVENAGLLKMDFLGLKTLTLIKDTVKIVKARHGVELIPDDFPLDDSKTYELFQEGATIGVFQYESPGMQKHLRSLKPTAFDDLIAMNALYRPGPMEYIPQFIRRKHGQEPIEYDLPVMEERLKMTYGITVYQEQVMLLSQDIADFTKGQADKLRKAMGKKQIAVLNEMKPLFIKNGTGNGHPEDKLEKIWRDWEAFASYAFNKSHSTCYAYIAFQTAYLKAHYPAEYMAAVLSNNMREIKTVAFFMEECRRMGIPVLSPDVNESYYKFAVNDKGEIRFGMGAIKNVGEGAVASIVEERKKNGAYKSLFDLVKRVNLQAVNKRAIEGLALGGGFDSFSDVHRAQYFKEENGQLFLERILKFGARYQENANSAQLSLFGESSEVQIPEPEVPPAEEWGTLELLRREKEVIGMFVSGHPLDDYKYELQFFCNGSLSDFSNLQTMLNREKHVAGIVTSVDHRISKNGKGWCMFTVEDYDASHDFRIFGEEYLKFRHFLVQNAFLFLKIFVKEGWTNKEGKKGDPRTQFRHMSMLQDTMKDLAKKLTVKIDIAKLNSTQLALLKDSLQSYKGKSVLNFLIYDMEEKIKINMHSKTVKIDISKALLDELSQNEITFLLNNN